MELRRQTSSAMTEELKVVLRRSEQHSGFGFSLLGTTGPPHVIYDIVENSPAADCGAVSGPSPAPNHQPPPTANPPFTSFFSCVSFPSGTESPPPSPTPPYSPWAMTLSTTGQLPAGFPSSLSFWFFVGTATLSTNVPTPTEKRSGVPPKSPRDDDVN